MSIPRQGRTILHVDCNSFFASVSLLYKPHLKRYPVVVGGDEETRHGIVLAKNEAAKRYKIPTGAALWQARQLCPNLVVIPPDYELYRRFSSEIKSRIFAGYTDMHESFGTDESWLDVTGSAGLFGNGMAIAERIRRQVKREMGITVSIGVSWNKIFAKLGSDMKKPDAITEITPDSYREQVWPLAVEELLYVGPATKRKLNSKGVYTIGQLANTGEQYLRDWFGVVGSYLWQYANGLESSPVGQTEPPVKSVGRSAVMKYDVTRPEVVKRELYRHASEAGAEMRELGITARTVKYWICDNDMGYMVKQCPLPIPSNLDGDLAGAAFAHFQSTYLWHKPIRKIGFSATNLLLDSTPYQICLWQNARRHQQRTDLQAAVDACNKRWPHSIKRALTMYPGHRADDDTKDMQRMFSPVGWL